MKLTNNWFTSVTEGESGAMVIVCGRDEIDAFMGVGKVRGAGGDYVAVRTYPSTACRRNGTKRMEAPQEALQKAMEKDKLSILTGVYTGDGARTWIFYTRNIPAFGERLNQALAPFEQLPITIYTEKDPDWNEYREMCSLCENACRDVQSDDEE